MLAILCIRTRYCVWQGSSRLKTRRILYMKLVRYWKEVISEAAPLTSTLGYVDNLITGTEDKVAIAKIIYMARKTIARHWLDPNPTTVLGFIKVN